MYKTYHLVPVDCPAQSLLKTIVDMTYPYTFTAYYDTSKHVLECLVLENPCMYVTMALKSCVWENIKKSDVFFMDFA
jgi:hypothetical protein